MESFGIVRKLDPLGRIVLPVETRREFFIDEDSSLEVFIAGDKIILKKYNPGCIFCGELDNPIIIEVKKVCIKCAEKISTSFNKSKY